VLVILYFLSAFSGITRTLPANRWLKPYQLNACSPVTRAEVEEAVGRSVNDGDGETLGRASTCHYGIKGGLVSITIQRLTTKPDLQLEIAALKKELPEPVVRAAPRFPEAFYLDLPDTGTQLHIAHNNSQHLMISILGFGAASQVSGAPAQIARKAMRRCDVGVLNATSRELMSGNVDLRSVGSVGRLRRAMPAAGDLGG
jgi:hypothetical protein